MEIILMPIDLDKMLFKLKLKQDGEPSEVKLLVDKDSVISTTMMLVILESPTKEHQHKKEVPGQTRTSARK
jgi:hypothetical protein